MWNADKVLVVFPPHASLLLPERVFPDNDRSYPFLCQEVNHTLAGSVQVVIDAPVARVRDAFHLLGDPFSIRFGKQFLEFLHVLVLPLVPRFDRTTVTQARDKALSALCYRRSI